MTIDVFETITKEVIAQGGFAFVAIVFIWLYITERNYNRKKEDKRQEHFEKTIETVAGLKLLIEALTKNGP